MTPGATMGGKPLARWEGEPVEFWRARWRLSRLEVYASLGSTNDRARDLVEGGAVASTVVLAEEQRAGRGRSGRAWHSPAGLGLWFSILLPVEEDVGGELPLLVGLAAARGIEAAVPSASVLIEWPNDLQMEDRKVGGVLCERVVGRRGPVVVAGVGLNVSQRSADFPAEVRGRAASLETVVGEAVRRPAVVGAVLRELLSLPPPGGGLPEPEWRELAGRDALRGREVETSGGLRGVARGIARDGALEVEAGGRITSVRAGSVWPVGRGGPSAGGDL